MHNSTPPIYAILQKVRYTALLHFVTGKNNIICYGENNKSYNRIIRDEKAFRTTNTILKYNIISHIYK